MSSASTGQLEKPVAGRWRRWAVAASVYLLAVMHRTSLGVASLKAENRFHVTPAQLAAFVFLQLGVYAAMQVPTGLLVDRYGPKRLLVTAAGVMGLAQLLFAVVPSYPAALFARALLGCGDALTFVSVLRFVAGAFAPRRYQLLVALTALCGTVGNVVATLPLAVALRDVGWVPTFGVAGLLSVAAALAALVALPGVERPGVERPAVAPAELSARAGTVVRSPALVRRRIRAAWQITGTRVGYWVHFTCMSTTTAFGVLWGGPYLVHGAGLTTPQAGTVLMAGVVFAALVTPALGAFLGARRVFRVGLAWVYSLLTVVALAVLAGLGDHPPRAYVIAFFVVVTIGAPLSMAAFAVTRDYNEPETLGTASGLVNVGGFAATIVIVLGMGWMLDRMGGLTPHNLRMALLVAIAVQGWGVFRLAVWTRRGRAEAFSRMARGEIPPVVFVRHRWDLAPPAAALDQQATPW